MTGNYPANPNYLPPRINRYVDDMRYDANVDSATGLTRVWLGALTAGSATAISSAIQMVNGSAVTQTYGPAQGVIGGAGAPFGRTLQFVASSTNTRAITVEGVDYMGQPIRETVTLTSATIVYSKKAYYKLNKLTFASASDTTTVNVGTANRFGVPYAMSRLLNEVQDGVVLPNIGSPIVIGKEINQTDLLAGTSHWLPSPMRGYVTRLTTIVQAAVTTGGTLTVEIGGVAVTGLSNVIADSATAGTVVTDTPTDPYKVEAGSGLVAANGAIELVGDAAFATAGVVFEQVEVTPYGVIPKQDTQSATSYDPRGLFEPSTTPNGTINFELIAMVDVNNTNGFYGSAHYNG